MRQFDWLKEIINFKTVKMKNTGQWSLEKQIKAETSRV